MAHEIRGDLSVPKGRLAVVVGRWNESVTGKLLAGAIQTLHDRGVPDDSVDVVWVPGAFEIPTVAGRLVRSGRYVAVLCLGGGDSRRNDARPTYQSRRQSRVWPGWARRAASRSCSGY